MVGRRKGHQFQGKLIVRALWLGFKRLGAPRQWSPVCWMEEINLFLLRPPQQEDLPEDLPEGPQEDLPEEQEGNLLKWRQSVLPDTGHCQRQG